MKVKIINKSKNELPKYQTEHSAGLDIMACLDKDVVLNPMERRIIPTGIFLEIPQGYQAQVRSRSGLSIKNGIICLNSPGTIDSDYRGEIGVILMNLSNESFTIKNGDRIAQMVFSKYEKIYWEQTEELSDSKRATGGFGSTGA